MGEPNPTMIEVLKKRCPVGALIELPQTDDPQAPTIGTQGAVIDVDDIGNIIAS